MQYIIVIYNSVYVYMSAKVIICVFVYSRTVMMILWKLWCLELEILMFGKWARALPPKTLESAPMRSQTSPTTHKARGRSQKHTFHPIIVIVIMLKMTMIIINGDHLHLSIILILSPLFTPLSQILWQDHIIISW